MCTSGSSSCVLVLYAIFLTHFSTLEHLQGGLLFPYYVGIIVALRDEFGVLGQSTPVAGASAGSLIAATCKSGISESDLIQVSYAGILVFYIMYLLPPICMYPDV